MAQGVASRLALLDYLGRNLVIDLIALANHLGEA